jgi:hypothetical protein
VDSLQCLRTPGETKEIRRDKEIGRDKEIRSDKQFPVPI